MTSTSDQGRVLYQILGGAPPPGGHVAALPSATLAPDSSASQGDHGVVTDQPQPLWRPGARLFIINEEALQDPAEPLKVRMRRALSAAQLAKHNIFTRGCHTASTGVVAVSGTATLEATGDVVVYASGRANVIARGEQVKVFACDNATGHCYGSGELEAGGHAIFDVHDRVKAKATEHARVRGHGRSRVEGSSNASVDLFDFATGDGKENSTFRGYNRSRISATDLSKVRTFDQSKEWLKDRTDGVADGHSQMFAAPTVKTRRLGFASVLPLVEDTSSLY